VLLGEDFGGGHHRTLPASFDSGEKGGNGDHGLARSHLPLEQTVHGVRPGEIGLDLHHDPALGGRQLVGQAGDEPPGQVAHRGMGHSPRRLLLPAFLHGQGDLESEQLVERQAVAGGRDVVERLREVDGAECPVAIGHACRQPRRLGH
jgi:hypothetical protein